MKNTLRFGLVALAVTLGLAVARPNLVAQEGGSEAGAKADTEAGAEGGGFKNLQVLDADMPKQQLKGIMKGFTQQLGVECSHCHVPDHYELDDKEPKKVARAMIRMMKNLRENQDTFFPGGRIEHLRCWTCHRGQDEPDEWVPPPQD